MLKRQGYGRKSLVLSVLLLGLFSATAWGQRARSQPTSEPGHKISPYLADEIRFLRENPAYDYEIPVIVRLSESARRSEAPSGRVHSLDSIRSYSALLRGDEIARLQESDQVERISIDSAVHATKINRSGRRSAGPELPDNDYLATIGVRETGFDGAGMTVAVFDSGIYGHPDLDFGNKIVFSVDFTSGEAVITDFNRDDYGHGTHVAGLIAGDGRSSGGLYRGVAPGASLIDVKVLGDDGVGRVSHLIAAMEWIADYKDELGVDVANLSVSTPAFEPFYEDPLCEAAKGLTRAGITVISSSGNLGKLEGYPEIWGSVTSPGTSPYVLTVYPLNHKGTANRADDVATTYGSRGPSFGTNLWKPDLAAPGNRIVSLASPGSFLASEAADPGLGSAYLELSGASMATPLVSGAALVLLQAEPRLSPLGVKTVLLNTTTTSAAGHPLELGRGTLNLTLALHVTSSVSRARDAVTSGLTDADRSSFKEEGISADRRGSAWADGFGRGSAWADRRGSAWADDFDWGSAWADRRGSAWADGFGRGSAWADRRGSAWADDFDWGSAWADRRGSAWADDFDWGSAWADAFAGWGSAWADGFGWGSAWADTFDWGSAWADGFGRGSAWADGFGRGSAWADDFGRGSAWADDFGHGSAWADDFGWGSAWADALVDALLRGDD